MEQLLDFGESRVVAPRARKSLSVITAAPCRLCWNTGDNDLWLILSLEWKKGLTMDDSDDSESGSWYA